MRILITVAALGFLLAGCQASGSSPAVSTIATAPPASSAPAPSTGAPSSATGAANSPGSAAVASAPEGSVGVTVEDFRILPVELMSRGGINLFVKNDGPTVHNVTIRDEAGKVLMGTRDLREGETAVLAGTLPPGRYITFCTLPGHESLGTKGTLVVAP